MGHLAGAASGPHPRSQHPSGATGIAWLELGGDEVRLREWLGGADLPIRVVDGEPGLRAVGLRESSGAEVVLG